MRYAHFCKICEICCDRMIAMNRYPYLIQTAGLHCLFRYNPPAGLPLGPLNPLKSLFKHLVPNVPKSQKVVAKVPISV